MRVAGRSRQMRTIRRRWPRTSLPEGVLPGRSSTANGRPTALSYTWIGRKIISKCERRHTSRPIPWIILPSVTAWAVHLGATGQSIWEISAK
jgi:hypothetical protein